MKNLPNIWCKFESLHFSKILDHILLQIDQMFECQMIFIHLSSKRQISIDSVGTGSNLNYMCLIVCSLFFQKIISRYTSSHFIIDPPRGLQDSTPSYHRSCPPFWPHFEIDKNNSKKIKKNVKPSRCILIYVLVTIQNNKLGIMQIS